MSTRINLAVFTAVIALAIVVSSPARGAVDITIQIMASDGNWKDQSFTGHAFICLQLPVSNGVKEDCYGFYPRQNGTGLIGGPGIVDSEFDFDKHPPTRFSNVKASVTKAISLQERKKILDVITGFDKNFTVGIVDCVRFSNAVAKAAGLKVPTETTFTTPVSYIKKLQQLNPGI
jgi:hypothetical protein